MTMIKYFLLTITAFACFIISSFSQNCIVPDLHHLVKINGIEVYNRALSMIDDPSYPGISLSKDYGEGLAWLKDMDFSEGIIEFDVRGEDVKQHSFVGIAFHVQNDSTFEALYLRPFQFREEDDVLRSHAIQYVSLPKFTWRVLRANSPGVYEAPIDPSPDPNAWVRVKLVIKDSMVSTFINGSNEPNLVVKEVTLSKGGAIGFYVADTSGGDFANIRITKTK